MRASDVRCAPPPRASRGCRSPHAATQLAGPPRTARAWPCTGRGEETIVGSSMSEPACACWCESLGDPAEEVEQEHVAVQTPQKGLSKKKGRT
jgi:hypothetical protein